MVNLYLVRHGESEANAAMVVQGFDSPLTERGREQAQFLASRFRNIPLDSILASSMPRARETGQFVHDLTGAPIEYSDLFIETRQPSSILGKSDDDPEVISTRRMMREKFGDATYRHSDEETFGDMKARGLAALTHIESLSHENILVVSHGAFIRILVGLMLFGTDIQPHELMSLRRFLFATNTGITWCTRDFFGEDTPRWVLRTWMDHAHLGEA